MGTWARRWVAACGGLGVVVAAGCDEGAGTRGSAPTSAVRVTEGAFSAPSDGVSSPDGETFYFIAHDGDGEPAVFRTSSAPGSVASPIAGGGGLGAPSGLVMSCDGQSLYLADAEAGAAPLSRLASSGGAPVPLEARGIALAYGVAMAPDCQTLHVTGRTEAGAPAVFSLARAGGEARVIYAGDPLVTPSGIHVDALGVSWVMDTRNGAAARGVLFQIPADGSAATPVLDDLRLGRKGGVSLTSAGDTAVIPSLDAKGQAQLLAVELASGHTSVLKVPDMLGPTGIRTARDAPVMIVVDGEGDAIFRVE